MDEGLLIGIYLIEVCVIFVLGVFYILFGLSDLIYVGIFSISAILTNILAANQICGTGIPWTSQIMSSLLPLFLIFILIALIINSPFGSGWLVPFANTFGPFLYGKLPADPELAEQKQKKYNRLSKILWYFLSAVLTLSYSLNNMTNLTCEKTIKEIQTSMKDYIKQNNKDNA